MKSQAFHGEVWINAHEDILDAVVRVNSEPIDGGYGNDSHTGRAKALMQRYFDTPIAITCTINGTAANVMAMKAMLNRWDAVLCAEQTHMHTYEAGAFEFGLGNKIITAKTPDGKLIPQIIRDTLTATKKYHYNPKVIVMAQPTEYGTVYTADEIRDICTLAHALGMYVYVDGARIGCGAASLGIGLREMIGETGADAFSFGGTKAGALFGEMVVFLRPEFFGHLDYSQKQSLQHMSKSKFLGAQMEVILEKELWIRAGEASNAMAKYMETRLRELGYAIYYPVESNMVFCVIPPEKFAPLCEVYDMHYWDEFTHVVRLATTYRTTKEEVDALAEALGG
ncbi:MAG: aminotransferase class I/II-fold pyridoxal phosphate-dependent enzyme [Clostridia bacterium]|nr:aminotransferase class I/II-fold pyridoxal phosphate-dependent enzyme [Clostridia bacterium]